MKLSIIITCYNQRKLIKEAADSALNQKLDDEFEIIIADDGSDDGSWEFILDEYGSLSNIKCFQMERKKDVKYIPHIRASQCRVEALKYVTGEYFAYLDGDDFYCDDTAMQKKINILDQPENNDVVLVGSRCIIYSDGDFKNPLGPERAPEGRIKTKRYWDRYYIHSNTCVFRSSVIPKLPYNIIGKVFHDNIIVFAALQHGSMYYIKDITMAYRQNTSKTEYSIWTNNTKRTNLIRQIIDIDIAIQLNPSLYRVSYCRYIDTIGELLKNQPDETDKVLYELAKELSCKETLQILDWRKNSLIRKIYILSKHSFYQSLCKVQWLCEHILLQTRFQKYIH